MKTDPFLVIEGLSASFSNDDGEEQQVLSDVSIQLEKGMTLGIVGESGSGKSVTSLSLMGLIPSPPIKYSSGSSSFGEEKIDLLAIGQEMLRELRGKKIAMIFQEPMSALNPLKRCGDQVMEAILVHQELSKQEAESQVLELFSQVKLPDPNRALKSYPHELSGGQLQRVMIAMAISNSPELLIADEPTTALDVTVQREVIELLQALQQKEGMAMIFISHDLGVVSQIADDLVVMKAGQIIEQGKTKEILQNPNKAYTKGLLASRPPINTRPHRLITVSDYEEDENVVMDLVPKKTRQEVHKKLYDQKPIITAEDIHTWYPVRQGLFKGATEFVKAVNGVSFDLYPSETLGVVGESGCGKSTLGRTIIGLESLHAGSIFYKGQEIALMKGTERRQYVKAVQMIFQDPYSSLNPRICIGDAIKEPMDVHSILNSQKERKAHVLQLLEQVGLRAEHYDRYPHEFSGGQRQRICIARTLALNPEVIICDESVSALDVSVQAQVLNLLNELKKTYGLSYIFISHDLSVVRYMSDRVIVMNNGQMEEYKEADELYENPEAEYTKRLIASAYVLD